MTTTNKKKIAIIIIVAVITVCISCVIYSKIKEEVKTDPVIVTNTTTREIREAIPGANDTTVKDVSRQIERVTEREAPRQEWYSTDQQSANKKAETFHSRDNGDVLLKETTMKPVDRKTNIIENKYYSVSTARKHDIQVGGATIGGDAYITAGYRNRDVTYTAFYDPIDKKGGAGVSVVVAKW